MNEPRRGRPPAVVPPIADSKAQEYAQRVWDGQSVDVPVIERVNRVRAALTGQSLSIDGVKLPGAERYL